MGYKSLDSSIETYFIEFKIEPSIHHFSLVYNNFLMHLSKQGSE